MNEKIFRFIFENEKKVILFLFAVGVMGFAYDVSMNKKCKKLDAIYVKGHCVKIVEEK